MLVVAGRPSYLYLPCFPFSLRVCFCFPSPIFSLVRAFLCPAGPKRQRYAPTDLDDLPSHPPPPVTRSFALQNFADHFGFAIDTIAIAFLQSPARATLSRRAREQPCRVSPGPGLHSPTSLATDIIAFAPSLSRCPRTVCSDHRLDSGEQRSQYHLRKAHPQRSTGSGRP